MQVSNEYQLEQTFSMKRIDGSCLLMPRGEKIRLVNRESYKIPRMIDEISPLNKYCLDTVKLTDIYRTI